jgi:hypothetical protein
MRKVEQFNDSKKIFPFEIASYRGEVYRESDLELFYPDNREDICVMGTLNGNKPGHYWGEYLVSPSPSPLLILYWKSKGKISSREIIIGEMSNYARAPEILNFNDYGNRFRIDYRLTILSGFTKSYISEKSHVIKKEDIIWGGCFDGYREKIEWDPGTTCKVYSYVTDSKGKTRSAKKKVWEPW